MYNNIGLSIKETRKKLGITQEELAKKVGVNESTISRWESGNIKSMRESHLRKINEVLNLYNKEELSNISSDLLIDNITIDEKMKKLYDNIKRLREFTNMTQEELAEKVGYSNRSAITRIENYEIDISYSKILAFSEAFGIEPEELINENNSLDIEDKLILSSIKSLSKKQKQILMDQINLIKKYYE